MGLLLGFAVIVCDFENILNIQRIVSGVPFGFCDLCGFGCEKFCDFCGRVKDCCGFFADSD